MSKSAKKRSNKTAAMKPTNDAAGDVQGPQIGTGSKQSRVIAMLQSADGTTIDAMMKATGWQQHSVRGFLAGVVRKKLRLKLSSTTVDGRRIYRIDQVGPVKASNKSSKRRAA